MNRLSFRSGTTQLYILYAICTCLLLTSCGGIFYTPPTAAEYCGIDAALLEPEAEGKTVLEFWVAGERHLCWRAYAPLVAAHQRPDLALAVRVNNLEMNNNPLTDRLMELAARGGAPDIAEVSHSNAVRLGEAGHLYPLDECIQRPEFQSVPDGFWHAFSPDKQTWGIPMESDILLLFYNKDLLRQLGWTEAEVDTLPKRIFDGTFTLQDLITTARQAVESGTVRQGLAFIPGRSRTSTIRSIYSDAGGRVHNDERSHFRIDKDALEQTYSFFSTLTNHHLLDRRFAMRRFSSWGNKLLVKDAATHNQFLFWHTVNTDIESMAEDYAQDLDDVATLNERIGVSLLPAINDTQSGYSHVRHSGQYVIFADHASGRNNQDVACDLIAATHASGLLEEHAEKSGYATFSEKGIHMPSWFPTEVPEDRLQFIAPEMLGIRAYQDILAETAVLVERGELTASEGTDVAVERLRDEFGDQLIVE